MNRMKGMKKSMMLTIGIAGGTALLGAGAYLLWNSKKMRMFRTVKRVERVLARTGEALQSVSEIV